MSKDKRIKKDVIYFIFVGTLAVVSAIFFMYAFSETAHAAKKKKAPVKKITQGTITAKPFEGDDLFIHKKGVAYYENSEYEKAIEYFKYIQSNFTSSFYYDMALYMLGESYRKLSRFDEAVAGYLFLLEKCPGSTLAPEALHNMANIYKQKGVSGEAIKYYKKLLDEYPDSFWAEEARVFLRYNSAPVSSIEEKAQGAKGFKNAAGPLETKIKLDELDSLDKIDFEQFDFSSYISGSKEYKIADYGEEDLALYRDGLKFHEVKNYDKAKWCYQKLILKYKNSLWYPNAFYMLGNCFVVQNDTKAATRFYSAALIYARDRALMNEIKQNLADLLFVDGRYSLALRYYEALASDPSNKEKLMQLYFLIGECNTKLGNSELAAKAYARVALEPSPDNISTIKKPSTSPQKEEIAIAVPIAPDFKKANSEIDDLIAGGLKEFSAKNYLKSISALERALVIDADNLTVLWNLALSYNQIEKHELASGYLQKYLSVAEAEKMKVENLKQAYSLLAYIYIKLNQFDGAREQYLKLISADPSSQAAGNAKEALRRIELMKKRAGNEYEN